MQGFFVTGTDTDVGKTVVVVFKVVGNGKASVVLLQAAKNQFETIWTYGESPFPPAKSDLPPLSEAS